MKQLLLTLFLLSSPLAAEPLVVAVSVPAQATLVKEIAKNRVEVITLIPPRANPHIYEPKPSQLAHISKAHLYFAVGAAFEFEQAWMSQFASINPDLKIINSSKGISIHGDHDHPDPHFWLSPLGCKVAINNITQALIQADPKAKDFYQNNRKTTNAKLDSLHSWITKTLENLNPRVIIVHHPAWTHYAHDYNLKQIAIEQHGKDPTPRHMAYAIEQIKKHGIRRIFVQNAQHFSTGSAKMIARETGAHLVSFSPIVYTANDLEEYFQLVTDAISNQQSEHAH